jgi:hypothetical protein
MSDSKSKKVAKLPEEPVKKDNNFFTRKDARFERMSWLLGLVLSIPCSIIARHVFHNPVAGDVLFLLGMLCYVPMFVITTWQLFKLHREMKQLKLEMTIMKTFVKYADPEEFKRIEEREASKKEARKLFGGKRQW